MRFTPENFSFERFSLIDRRYLEGISPENYSFSNSEKKYRQAFQKIIGVFKTIQKLQSDTENDSYKRFSSVLLTVLSKQAQEFAGDVAVENILDAISSSTGLDSLREALKKKIVTGIQSSESSSSGLQDLFEENVKTIENFLKFFGNDVRPRMKEHFQTAFKILRSRFDRDVVSIVDQSLKKAVRFSDELREEYEEDRLGELQDDLEKLSSDIDSYGMEMSDWNRNFLLRQQKTFEKQAFVNRKFREIGTRSSTDLLLKNLQSTNKKFSEFSLGMTHLRSRWNRLFINEERIRYLQDQADEIRRKIQENGYEFVADKTVGFQATPLGIMQKAAAIAFLPVVKVLRGINDGIPSTRNVIGFSKGVISGVKDSVGFVLGSIGKFAKSGTRLAVNALKAPFSIVGKIDRLINSQIGKGLLEFLATDTGAAFLGTLSAFFKVFVVDEVVDAYKKLNGQLGNLGTSAADVLMKGLKGSIVDDWTRRFSGDKFSFNDKRTIGDYEEKRKKYLEGGKRSKSRREKAYLYSQSAIYGISEWILRVNVGIKGLFDKMFPPETETGETDEAAKEFKEKRNDYLRTISLFRNKESFISKTKVFQKYMNDKLAKFNLREFVTGGVVSAEQLLGKFKDLLIGTALTTGGTLIGGKIGAIIGGPLGAVIGGAVGYGAGKFVQWARKKARLMDMMTQDLVKYVTQSYKDVQRQRRNERTSEMYEKIRSDIQGQLRLQGVLGEGEQIDPFDKSIRKRIRENVKDSRETERLLGQLDELWSLRATGGMTAAEKMDIDRLRDYAQSDVRATEQWYEGGKSGKAPISSRILSFEVPILGNGVKKYDRAIQNMLDELTRNAPEGEVQAVKERFHAVLAETRYIVGKNIVSLLDMYKDDDYDDPMTAFRVAEIQKRYFDFIFDQTGKYRHSFLEGEMGKAPSMRESSSRELLTLIERKYITDEMIRAFEEESSGIYQIESLSRIESVPHISYSDGAGREHLLYFQDPTARRFLDFGKHTDPSKGGYGRFFLRQVVDLEDLPNDAKVQIFRVIMGKVEGESKRKIDLLKESGGTEGFGIFSGVEGWKQNYFRYTMYRIASTMDENWFRDHTTDDFLRVVYYSTRDQELREKISRKLQIKESTTKTDLFRNIPGGSDLTRKTAPQGMDETLFRKMKENDKKEQEFLKRQRESWENAVRGGDDLIRDVQDMTVDLMGIIGSSESKDNEKVSERDRQIGTDLFFGNGWRYVPESQKPLGETILEKVPRFDGRNVRGKTFTIPPEMIPLFHNRGN